MIASCMIFLASFGVTTDINHTTLTKLMECRDNIPADMFDHVPLYVEFFDEERQIYWYPSVINMGPKGIIFPEGNLETWYWRYAKVIFIPEEERENYPVPGKDGEFYESRLDVEGAKRFGQFEFLDACTDMGLVKDNLENNFGSSGVI